MADPGCEKTSKAEADEMKVPSEEFRAVHGKPDETGAAAPMMSCPDGESPMNDPAVSGSSEGQTDGPRLIYRDGVAYVEGCDVPVWRLEMGRRAGSSPTATIGAFPSLTPQGLELAFAYAREHRAEFDPLIQYHSGADVPLEEQEDDEDEATFEAELDALLERDAELLRRLAR